MTAVQSRARYDGMTEWYDEFLRSRDMTGDVLTTVERLHPMFLALQATRPAREGELRS